ncbi:hypothetical protein BEWA_034190 [Theileria equi strain WA]|uniref:Uncharacterized protein n=1 Tax=Theileria equi strain WA TaxID=1537102 RepID=L0AYA2_THEEQ|nr:hypothetical protein BEWA_034190 [Theileria equi strain WA]AFZ80562.1 hypothetical protein BEWA_034190 [Theileria equi strain WA]|eukprot:XP_004830228.1 hypothetical protein BEWA_034190 [Theileria equi strain WA]
MFPAYKVLCVFIRQISKPFANYLKRRASENEGFRNICIAFGNRSFAFDRYISRRFYNSEVGDCEPVTISQERSVNIGTELLGECVIFGIAAALITAEYARSVRKEFRKEAKLQERLNNIDLRQQQILDSIKEEVNIQLDKRLASLENSEDKKPKGLFENLLKL